MGPRDRLPSLSLVANFRARVGRLVSTPQWAWTLALWCVLFSLFFAFPTYTQIDHATFEVVHHKGEVLFDQDNYGEQDRGFLFTFRVLVPLVGGMLNLGTAGYFVLQAVVGFLLFVVVARLVERETSDRVTATFLTLGLALTYAGSVAFLEVRANFDGTALLFLAVAALAVKPLGVFLATFAATWTDERAIFAASLVLLFHALKQSSTASAVALAVVVHAILRFVLTQIYDLTDPLLIGGHAYFTDQFNNLPLGLWTGLESLWLLVGAACVVLWHHRQKYALMSYFFFMAGVTALAIAVIDVTRSMIYLLPAVFVAVRILSRTSIPDLRKLAGYALALSLVWPVYYVGGNHSAWWAYPLPLQAVRYVLGLY